MGASSAWLALVVVGVLVGIDDRVHLCLYRLERIEISSVEIHAVALDQQIEFGVQLGESVRWHARGLAPVRRAQGISLRMKRRHRLKVEPRFIEIMHPMVFEQEVQFLVQAGEGYF